MTATWVLAAGVLLIFGLLAVVSWHLIQTLRQTRRTAAALEEFLTSTRPRIEEAVDQLRTVLARAERMMTTFESGPLDQAHLAGSVGRLVNTFTTVLHTVSAFTALAKGVVGALRSFQSPRERSRAPRRK